MKFVLAPDSFKGTLNASEVCDIERQAIRQLLPDAQIVSLPMADGGEGTLEAIAAARLDARRIQRQVHDPLGRVITAEYLHLPEGPTAVIEMAQASGLTRLAKHERNPLVANTFGTGELIRDALADGMREILVGLGGSATVDGGWGLAAALGARVLDEAGRTLAPQPSDLTRAAEIFWQCPYPEVRVTLACDVTNPLLGPQGAAAVFGPQKGATPEMVRRLEEGLTNWSRLWKDEGTRLGDGAAGGVAFALRQLFPQCQMLSGGEIICTLAKLDEQLADATLVITGEGASDRQTLLGKLPMIVSRHARLAKVPCALLSGYLPDHARKDLTPFFPHLFGTIEKRPDETDLTHENCVRNLFQATQRLIRTVLDNH